jgi:hypothetical protein
MRINPKKKTLVLYVPRAERPMVPVHCVGELARFGTSQCVAHVTVRVESKSVAGKFPFESAPNDQGPGAGRGRGNLTHESGYLSSL